MPMLDVDDIRMYYTVKGEGIPIVFIHPPLLTSANFMYQMEELSRNFKVIAFDIRGHGRSPYSNQAITYQTIAEDIRQLLDYLGVKKAFICGYSTGGTIALEYLLAYPDRSFGGIVISGMSEVNDRKLKQMISIAITLAKAKTLPILSLSISWSNSDTNEAFKKLYTEALKGDARNIEQYYRYSLHYNCTSQLQKIDLPLLLVYGKKDKTFINYANILHEKLPCNDLKFIENEKHQIPTKAAVILNEMIKQFIQTLMENGHINDPTWKY
ncbi:alpha/beta hydrolase [Cytobacillus depressus]|uniref:Alpha/beta hydrolase n=1 Tax=Cytobacillus depressus TaxID=1602942 RepID=A0A6L3V1Y8_9BACI|nr:alpha/beta hydrolase [Cytobacillus depressus]KAB2332176.1 alpha/beta hydrolase [Cytobacillus depressus]